MRFLSLLLALVVVTLAFKPGIETILAAHCDSEVTCCSDSCSAFDIQDDEESDGGSCDGGGCNPFQSCSSSFLLTLNNLLSAFHNSEVSTEKNFDYEFILHSQFASEFWQPPRLA